MLKLVVEELLAIKGITKKELARKLHMPMTVFKKHEFYDYRTMPVSSLTYMAWVLQVPFGFLSRMNEYDKFTLNVKER